MRGVRRRSDVALAFASFPCVAEEMTSSAYCVEGALHGVHGVSVAAARDGDRDLLLGLNPAWVCRPFAEQRGGRSGPGFRLFNKVGRGARPVRGESLEGNGFGPGVS